MYVRGFSRLLIATAVAWISSVGVIFAQHEDAALSGLPHNIPNFCANPTLTSRGSGSWASAGIWSAGRVPTSNDIVAIAAGHTITYDALSDAPVACVGVNGVLRFATDRNTRLTVRTVMVMPGGLLEIGREGAPIPAGRTAELVFPNLPLDTAWDPEQFGNGLIGFGKVVMHGAPRTPTFGRLTEEPLAGTNRLTLADVPAGWAPGDILVLPGTSQKNWGVGIEYPTVQSVSGRDVILTSPLLQNHQGARDVNSVMTFLPHVGNLGRSVYVRSANHLGTRGHALFTGRAEIDIRYVYFQNLGRTRFNTVLDNTTFDSAGNVTHLGTNQIGRYPIHMHHSDGPAIAPANGYQYTLLGNVVQGSPKWGITIHNSHYGLVKDNVVIDAGGAGVMLEDGSESFNVIDHNLVVFTNGVTEWAAGRLYEKGGIDMGFEGSGFWFRGFNNYVRNNVATNARLYGFTYFAHSLGQVWVPTARGSSERQPVDMNATPILQFANNETYGSMDGLTIWYLNAFGQTARGGGESIVKGFAAWHFTRYGYFGYHSNRVTFDGTIMRGDRQVLINDGNYFVVGFFYSDYFTKNHVVKNADIQGLKAGMLSPVFADSYGATGSTAGTIRVENSLFRNFWSIIVEPPWTVAGTQGLPPKKLIVNNVKFGPIPGMPLWMGNQATVVANNQIGNYNLIQRDEIHVYNYNQVPGDHFRVDDTQQLSTFVVPQTGSGGFVNLIGSPEPGLTNSQTWARYGIAMAGAIAPCTAGRPEIGGFTCAITEPPPSGGGPAPPNPPRNLRVVGTN